MIAYVFQKDPEKSAFQLFIILLEFNGEICHFLKNSLLFIGFVFSVYKQHLTAS